LDDFTRESLALIPDTSLPGARVARELDALIVRRGRPKSCVSDNGTELTKYRGDPLLQELQQLVEHLLHGGNPPLQLPPTRPRQFCSTKMAYVGTISSNSCSATSLAGTSLAPHRY
jgi:hypothetical protein